MTSNLTAVVTGSTGGIGAAIALQLVQAGWSLILVNRSQDKAKVQREELLQAVPSASVELVRADLMDLADIAKACAEVARLCDKVDALHNIAGVLTSERRISQQGFESNYAVNVLANYAFVAGLRPLLRRSPGEAQSMVLTMSSSAIGRVKALEIDELRNPQEIGGLMGAYAHTKLALTAISAELAPDLANDRILIRAIDPGATRTPMTSDNDAMPFFLRWLVPLLFSEPDAQARKIILAADPANFDQRSGMLIASGKRRKLPKTIQDAGLRDDLLKAVAADCADLIG